MRYCLPGLLLIAATVHAQEAQPTKVEPRNGRCSIEFPGKPTDRSADRGTQYIQQMLDGRAGLMLQFNEATNKVDPKDPEMVKKFFDKVQDAVQDALKGSKVTKSEDATFEKNPARDLELDVPDLGLYRVKLILTPNLFYQVAVCGPKDFVNGPQAKKFVESFKLKN